MRFIIKTGLLISLSCAVAPAFAHTGVHGGSGFASGFSHPLMGPDHVAAMLAVGLWASVIGRKAIWILPIAFPLVMAFGAVLGIAGIAVPVVESGIAASALVIGLAAALTIRPPLSIAVALVGIFALFHGHAHGTEMPVMTNPVSYGLGFLTGTLLLHLAGIGLGLFAGTKLGNLGSRAAGAAIALAGAGFLSGAI
ncbi:HupE/UreJ family protein [Qingshengfaniella alkalisoli]|uniref:HupE/UreJ family protein n=1 Tax=Qingshengfaniella alkalisoli TaxID=2599296 RepID=A0A5B8ISA4_9RHOB|nr:HupE/UreJ family protein [Qingshengfaniella alkalisoli]QDY69092.1 HupE/UreJ family protein [Qingshengfaniella alkalisoli]